MSDPDLRIFLTHVVNGYPKSIHVSRMVDPLVMSIVVGGVLPSCSQIEYIANSIRGYKQENERLYGELKDEWQPLELPGKFVQAISPQQLGLDVERNLYH
jgi:hypothetical protein